ncbi:hypothetical protein DFH08DRAFT_319682 [Mycena albidolilacea]|uniref:Uncharacterized protein n=1 Tax=Mycena albidolilacea TaxID=1033008 RepID=A0AAD7EIQ9_9AGAR|nr:hypothetical protein DFH08DRAFT_319682 [Mycena albidolilacea]
MYNNPTLQSTATAHRDGGARLPLGTEDENDRLGTEAHVLRNVGAVRTVRRRDPERTRGIRATFQEESHPLEIIRRKVHDVYREHRSQRLEADVMEQRSRGPGEWRSNGWGRELRRLVRGQMLRKTPRIRRLAFDWAKSPGQQTIFGERKPTKYARLIIPTATASHFLSPQIRSLSLKLSAWRKIERRYFPSISLDRRFAGMCPCERQRFYSPWPTFGSRGECCPKAPFRRSWDRSDRPPGGYCAVV